MLLSQGIQRGARSTQHKNTLLCLSKCAFPSKRSLSRESDMFCRLSSPVSGPTKSVVYSDLPKSPIGELIPRSGCARAVLPKICRLEAGCEGHGHCSLGINVCQACFWALAVFLQRTKYTETPPSRAQVREISVFWLHMRNEQRQKLFNQAGKKEVFH